MDMNVLFNPKSIAVVGASRSAGIGRTTLENLIALGYKGKIACINRRGESVLGCPAKASIQDLDFVPECIALAVNANASVEIIEQAATLGVKAALLYGIGFGEAGEEGQKLQNRIDKVAHEHGMLILGPNCQGFINFTNHVALYMSPVKNHAGGGVALISHSGSITTSLLNNKMGVSFDFAASTGNEAIIDAADVVEHLLGIDTIKVVCAYIETLRNPEKFFNLCEKAFAQGKRIVVLVSGKTEESQKAITAHSGALAPNHRLLVSALTHHNAIVVDTLAEMLSTTLVMRTPLPKTGNGVFGMATSGGQIQILLDSFHENKIPFLNINNDLRSDLDELIKPPLNVSNPLDYWGVPDIEQTMREIILRADKYKPDYIVLVVDFTLGPTGWESRAARGLRAVYNLLGKIDATIVLLDLMPGTIDRNIIEMGLPRGVLMLSGIDIASKALSSAYYMSRKEKKLENGINNKLTNQTVNKIDNHIAEIKDLIDSGVSTGDKLFKALGKVGLPLVNNIVISKNDGLNDYAPRLKYPIVAKTADYTILHKTEVGGVITDIDSFQKLTEAVEKIRKIGNGSVLLQEQLSSIVEVFVGLVTDPQLGSFVIIGAGGIWTEILDDVIVIPAGVGREIINEQLKSLKVYKMMTGARGVEHIDMESLLDLIETVSALGLALGKNIKELDLNPVFVDAKGCTVVDAVLVK